MQMSRVQVKSRPCVRVSKVFGFGVLGAHSGLGLEQLRKFVLIRTHMQQCLRSNQARLVSQSVVMSTRKKEATHKVMNELPNEDETPTVMMSRSPTCAPFTRYTVSRVRAPWAESTRSTPLSAQQGRDMNKSGLSGPRKSCRGDPDRDSKLRVR